MPEPAIPGYRDFTMIARGSTAFVYRAVQARLDRTVAVKILLVDDDMTTPASVAKELETTVRVSGHPHIVSIIDTGTTEAGQPYIVMEHCDGGAYSGILKDRGPLSVGDVVDVGVKIGQALHAAHDAGILHRDVKPQNILRGRYGPALADFGIARAPESLASTRAIDMLTPLHASPEALLRQPQTAASDLYSLASTMWHLLAGHAPFADPEGGTDPEVHRARVIAGFPPPALPRDDVPEWLERLLANALARDPDRRPGSCRDFAESLQLGALTDRLDAEEAAERTVLAPPVAPPPRPQAAAFAPPPTPPGTTRTARMPRRLRPGAYPMAAVVLIVAVALLGGIGVTWALATGDTPDNNHRTTTTDAAEDPSGTDPPSAPAPDSITLVSVDRTPSTVTFHTDAPEGELHCTLTVEAPERRVEGDCGAITVDGLHASTAFAYTLTPEGRDQTITGTAATATVTAEVHWDCPLSRAYCAEQNAEIGVGADPGRDTVIGTTTAGQRFEAHCHLPGGRLITPRGDEAEGYWDYHPGKAASDLAVMVDYHGQTGYIPFVWLIIDPGDLDSTGGLPAC